ncbi:uncharacterized protein BCR38DRAFT_510588, partial [Pseudomassariella vexata]
IHVSKFDKTTSLETAEHVGLRQIAGFFGHLYDLLEDDGVLYLQVAGLRWAWQYGQPIFGIMVPYSSGFTIFYDLPQRSPIMWVMSLGSSKRHCSIDTVGFHYSAAIWRWYSTWLGSADKVRAKYGDRWNREYFLAYGMIASRQATATCYHMILVKNIHGTH